MNIIAAILIFTIIVVFHEFGHFLLAKKNGVEVTEFSVGMGPRIITAAKVNGKFVCRLFCSQKMYEERQDWKHVTKYSWKVFPIGGSCMMVGEDEESSSENALNNKGVWARFSILFAGPFFNFVLAFIFSLILLGISGCDIPKVISVYDNQPGAEAGIKEGDIIKSIDGHKISIGSEVQTYSMLHVLPKREISVVVERNGKEKTLQLNPVFKTNLYGFSYGSQKGEEAKVSDLTENMPFAKAGIKKGDVIKAVNGEDVKDGADLGEKMQGLASAGKTVDFTIDRDGEKKEFTITPKAYTTTTLGFLASTPVKKGALSVIKYSLYEVRFTITSTIGAFKQLIIGRLSMKNLSGPVGIVNAVGNTIDSGKQYGIKVVLLELINMTVLISANLGVVNLFPLPALDGGRIIFVLIEAVRGKPIDREKEGLVHFIGFVALMLLMVYVMYNDIMNIIQ